MQPSSRTPEGESNDCPICGKALCLEPSLDSRDAPCPHCGHLLWFALPEETSPRPDEKTAQPDEAANVRRQIQNWVTRFATDARSIHVTREILFQKLIAGTARWLAATGIAVWTQHKRQWVIDNQIGLGAAAITPASLQSRAHLAMLKRVARRQKGHLVQPQSLFNYLPHFENPTFHHLVLCPIVRKRKTVAIAEVFQRPQMNRAAQQAYLHFLGDLCQFAGKSPALEELEPAQKNTWWPF